MATAENGFEVHEHMWSNEVFTAYVDEVAGEGCWKNKMQPRMEQIVTWSLLCAQVWKNTPIAEGRLSSTAVNHLAYGTFCKTGAYGIRQVSLRGCRP